jgi:hypothetical protein
MCLKLVQAQLYLRLASSYHCCSTCGKPLKYYPKKILYSNICARVCPVRVEQIHQCHRSGFLTE